MTSSLRQGSKQESPMQASKWLSTAILIDLDEMKALFAFLGDFDIFITSCLVTKGEGSIPHQLFLSKYGEYIRDIQEGMISDEGMYRSFFSSVFTTTVDSLYSLPTGDTQELIRVAKPVIQLQPHRIHYSKVDEKFRSMNYGPDSITWGIQFSYPQLFQDPQKEIHQTKDQDQFPNTKLFQQLQYWIRHHTSATPFMLNEKKINLPMRLGKNCFSWINQHPHLKKLGVGVYWKDERQDV